MSWTAPRTWTAGEMLTAALLNTHLRDNLLETSVAKVTTAGDMIYATAVNALARRAIGTKRKVLRINSGANAPEWAYANPQSLSVVTAEITVSNTSAETTIFSFSLPGGMLGTNNWLRILLYTSILNNTGGAVNFNGRMYYGSTSLQIQGIGANVATSGTRKTTVYDCVIKGDGATNAQRLIGECRITSNDAGTSGTVQANEGTAVIDSTVAQTVSLTILIGTASVNATLITRMSALYYMENFSF